MNMNKLNPFIRYAKSQHSITPCSSSSICYDCRLFFIESGIGQITIENNQYPFSQDTIIFLPSGTWYKFRFNDYSKIEILTFDFDLTDEFCEYKESLGTGNEENYDIGKILKTCSIEMLDKPIVLYRHSHLYRTLADCIYKFLTKEHLYHLSASAMLKLCLIDMIKNSHIDVGINTIIKEVVNYINENFSNPLLSNEMIADEFGYHPHYLSSLFKKVMGKTLHQYVAIYRMRVAKDLLITTDFDINTIAWKTGYNSTSYFIKSFSAQTGMTPKAYKNKNAVNVL